MLLSPKLNFDKGMTHLQCIRDFDRTGLFSSASNFQTCSKNEVYRYPTLSMDKDVVFLPSNDVSERSTISLELWKNFPRLDKQ